MPQIDTSEFVVDLGSLGRKSRLNGVSGLLRAKNDAEFLSLCIDSCISALDELIIVYQKSQDETDSIVYQKRKQYPNKIRVFYYEPDIRSHDLSPKEFDEVCSLPDDSVHLLSNYYNYTLSKASFRFAMKIDADQIYNTTKLRNICDAYRSTSKIQISLKERLINVLLIIMAFFDWIFRRVFHQSLNIRPPKSWAKIYSSYSLKIIRNKKITASFNGVNLRIKDDKAFVPFGKYEDNTFPPFNGIDDHLLFKITDRTFFERAPMHTTHAAYKRCVIERFKLNDDLYKPCGLSHHLIHYGFLWFHVAPLKKRFSRDGVSDDAIMPFEQKSMKTLADSLKSRMFDRHYFWYQFWWNAWDSQPQTVLDDWSEKLKLIRNVYKQAN